MPKQANVYVSYCLATQVLPKTKIMCFVLLHVGYSLDFFRDMLEAIHANALITGVRNTGDISYHKPENYTENNKKHT